MKKNKKLLTITITLLFVAALVCSLIWFLNYKNSSKISTKSPTGGINYSPATKDDLSRAEANKQRIIQEQNSSKQNSSSSSSLKTVTPLITYAGVYGDQVQIGARVNGIVESGGLCEATITKDGKSLTKTVSSVTDVSSTGCPEMSFQISGLPSKGDWSISVKYTSSTSSGTSTPKILKVD